MSYLLNTVDLNIYSIIPAHAPGSNIAVSGCFDLPARIGETYHDWGGENGIEPFVDSDDIILAGRDIQFYGSIIDTYENAIIYITQLKLIVALFTDLVVFSTPYGDFNVYVKTIDVEHVGESIKIVINFRQPVVPIDEGLLPLDAGKLNDRNFIDGYSFTCYGLYLNSAKSFSDLPDNKDQKFTKYSSEGYQIVKRKQKNVNITGMITAVSIADFQSKIANLQYLFALEGTRELIINDLAVINVFCTTGFKIDNVIVNDSIVVAKITIDLLVTTVTDYNAIELATPLWDAILTSDGNGILI